MICVSLPIQSHITPPPPNTQTHLAVQSILWTAIHLVSVFTSSALQLHKGLPVSSKKLDLLDYSSWSLCSHTNL